MRQPYNLISMATFAIHLTVVDLVFINFFPNFNMKTLSKSSLHLIISDEEGQKWWVKRAIIISVIFSTEWNVLIQVIEAEEWKKHVILWILWSYYGGRQSSKWCYTDKHSFQWKLLDIVHSWYPKCKAHSILFY